MSIRRLSFVVVVERLSSLSSCHFFIFIAPLLHDNCGERKANKNQKKAKSLQVLNNKTTMIFSSTVALMMVATTTILMNGAVAHQDEMSAARTALLRVRGVKRSTEEVNVSTVVLAPWTTEGPYSATLDDYANDANLTAAAVADNRRAVLDGVPLRLTFNVYDVVGEVGTELANASVFIWHCDTKGVYGAVSLAKNPSNQEDTLGKSWLRSVQPTNANGVVVFNTIVPGWYAGRTLHFHVRVRYSNAATNTTYAITTQIMFQDAVQVALKQISPYSAVTTAYTTLASDMIYKQAAASVGDGLLLKLAGNYTAGFESTFVLGIDRTATQAPGGMGGMMMSGMPMSRPSMSTSTSTPTGDSSTTAEATLTTTTTTTTTQDATSASSATAVSTALMSTAIVAVATRFY
jgi:protocatechuate 3,4-dioxygenase beta subunit